MGLIEVHQDSPHRDEARQPGVTRTQDSHFGVTPRQGASGQSFSKRIELEARGLYADVCFVFRGGHGEHLMPHNRLLLVDDAGICSFLNRFLSKQGFVCLTCSSGEEALALLEREAFDLVVTDLGMPGMSGLDFLERAHKKYPRSAFLIATGENDIRMRIAAMKQGAEGYLLKPFQFDAVLGSVHRALETKRLQIEVEIYRENLEQMWIARSNCGRRRTALSSPTTSRWRSWARR
jgi:DNA-binding NarL/FixJ family response regulator